MSPWGTGPSQMAGRRQTSPGWGGRGSTFSPAILPPGMSLQSATATQTRPSRNQERTPDLGQEFRWEAGSLPDFEGPSLSLCQRGKITTQWGNWTFCLSDENTTASEGQEGQGDCGCDILGTQSLPQCPGREGTPGPSPKEAAGKPGPRML